MQDLKKNKRRMNQQAAPIENNSIREESITEEIGAEDINRGYKQKTNNGHHNNECECNPCKDDFNHRPNNKHHDDECGPCELESDICIDNNCGPECCSPITPQRFSTANSVPYVIEANRVFDTMRFQTFTDATGPRGGALTFDIEVVDVVGSVPRSGQLNASIDKICMNYSGIVIKPGMTTLEDYDMSPLGSPKGGNCETAFEYAVCGQRNATCNNQGRGRSVVYKQRGLTVIVEDLVLELRGKCGCTEFVALATPSIVKPGGCTIPVDSVEFIFNTLSSPICVPADGRSFTLRQDYQTNLTVDCIGKALLSLDDGPGGEFNYELSIPNDIDLVCCLQETVSTLMSEQIVVLGAASPVQPRIVDTFSSVCDFSQSRPRNDRDCRCDRDRDRERERERDRDCKC